MRKKYKKMKKIIAPFLLIMTLISVILSCSETNSNDDNQPYYCPMKCEGEKTYDKPGSCPVCTMNLVLVEGKSKTLADSDEIAPESIFNLTSKWNTQNNKTIELKELKGDVLVMVMIYTTCKAACPRLVADMRNIAKKVNNEQVKYVLVSIDPETDTPEKLKEFAIENQMDTDQWVFLQGTIDDVREFSNVLAVKYKQISPIDFSHSNIISVFDTQGVLYHQQEGLGVDNSTTVSKILDLTK